jgi:hypothetical protein
MITMAIIAVLLAIFFGFVGLDKAAAMSLLLGVVMLCGRFLP